MGTGLLGSTGRRCSCRRICRRCCKTRNLRRNWRRCFQRRRRLCFLLQASKSGRKKQLFCGHLPLYHGYSRFCCTYTGTGSHGICICNAGTDSGIRKTRRIPALRQHQAGNFYIHNNNHTKKGQDDDCMPSCPFLSIYKISAKIALDTRHPCGVNATRSFKNSTNPPAA